MDIVKLYGTRTCSNCKMLKQWLGRNKITYGYVDLSDKKDLAEDILKESGFSSVPIFKYEGNWYATINPIELRRIFKRE